MGKQCTKYLKPLLDSGTEGTKGHVQVLVPFVTETYGHAEDRDEEDYPLCTLRNFPSTIQHTLQVEGSFYPQFSILPSDPLLPFSPAGPSLKRESLLLCCQLVLLFMHWLASWLFLLFAGSCTV